MKKSIAFLVVLIGICGCRNKDVTQPEPNSAETREHPLFAQTEWLIGCWENTEKQAHTIEEWKRVNDSVLHGHSVVIVGKDTVFSESVELIAQGDSVVYVVSVPGQNNELPVRFRMRENGQGALRFENPKHPRPSVIEYRQPVKDSLVAAIYDDAGKKMETFRMARTK